MNTQNGTTPAPETASPERHDYEEREDQELRERLGLRPIHHVDGEGHPDGRPCPPWCFSHRLTGYQHDVEPDGPYSAVHRLEPWPTIALTQYCGDRTRLGEGVYATISATLEVQLRQRGAAPPRVELIRNAYTDDGKPVRRTVLTLSIDDVCDLISALGYVATTAHAASTGE